MGCLLSMPTLQQEEQASINLYMAKHFSTGHIRSDSTEPTTFSCLLPSTCCTFQNKAGPIFPVLKLHKHTYLNYPLRQISAGYSFLHICMLRGFFPIPTMIGSDHKNIYFFMTLILHAGAKCPHGSLKAELMKQHMSTTS